MPNFSEVPRAFLPLALEGALRQVVSDRKVVPCFLRTVRPCLGADALWLYRGDRRLGPARWSVDGDKQLRDERRSGAFFRKGRPTLPRSLLLAPLRVEGHLVGVVGAARRAQAFKFGEGRVLNRLAYVLGEDLGRREDDRLTRVLGRIREEVLAGLRPRDLAYQILDRVHQLVQYDHSAALLLHDAPTRVLRVEAEKIVWIKAKSAFVGHEMSVGSDLLTSLAPGPGVVTQVVEPDGEPGTRGDSTAWDLLYYNRGEGIPAPSAIICAPLFFKGEVLGLLKIAARARGAFSERDLEVVRRFLPAAAVSLRNVRVRLSLEDQALRAESCASLVTLARAVAHDVNNAIGALLPLAEQARDDARGGRLDAESLEKDLAISEFPKGRKHLISLSFRGESSVRPVQVGGFDVNIVIQGSTAVRGRGGPGRHHAWLPSLGAILSHTDGRCGS